MRLGDGSVVNVKTDTFLTKICQMCKNHGLGVDSLL